MSEEAIANLTVASAPSLEGILDPEAEKATKDIGSKEIRVTSAQPQQEQEAPCNVVPQADIISPKKPAHYQIISGPKGKYLFSMPHVPVRVAICNSRPGLELSTSLRYKSQTHREEPVKTCPTHTNLPPEQSNFVDLRTPYNAAFLLAHGSRQVNYTLDSLHPTARVLLSNGAETDDPEIVFTCYSSCKPHRDRDKLMLLHLNIHDIKTKVIVHTAEIIVRVAKCVLARASIKYQKDMFGLTTPRRPSTRTLKAPREGCNNTAETSAKRLRLDTGAESNDGTSKVVDIIDDPDLNQLDEGTEDVEKMISYMKTDSNLAKRTVKDLKGACDTGPTTSTLTSDGQGNAMGSASIGSKQGSLDANVGNNSTELVVNQTPERDNFAVVGGNQTQVAIGGDNSVGVGGNQTEVAVAGDNSVEVEVNHIPSGGVVNLSVDPVPDTIAFLVSNLNNPEINCLQIQRYIQSLGASCTLATVLIPPAGN